jgi:DNA-binding GntR family transcriptional regulator
MSTGVVASDRPRALSKTRAAYSWIRERITDGSFGPGYRLVLSRIADQLNTSVIPVREAIRLLEAEGLVTYVRHVGAQVAMIDHTTYRDTMETLGVVEGAATGLAAEHLSVDDLSRARKINAEMGQCLERFAPRRFTELNFCFHEVLFERCPNAALLEIVRRTWDRMSSIRDSTFAFVPGRAHESVAEHEQLITLIEHGGEPSEIEHAARAHRHATLTAFLTHEQQSRRDGDTDGHGVEIAGPPQHAPNKE